MRGTLLVAALVAAGLLASCGGRRGDDGMRADSGRVMPDGSIPGRDSGGPPVECRDEVMTTFTVRVVQGPVPVAPAAGTPVRMEHLCGAFVEGTTGPDGIATLTLAGARGDRFDVTAWQPGYT